MYIRRSFFITVIWLLCFVCPLFADIAPDPMRGGISLEVPGHKKTDITLLHNTVKIQVSPTLCKTRAFFRLRNTGAPVALEVGFPLPYEGEAADFVAFIDGRRVSYKDRIEKGKNHLGQPYTNRWKVWNMKFNVSQTHLVEVRYSNPPAAGYSGDLGLSRYPFYYYWRETNFDYDMADFGYKEHVQLHNWLEIKSAKYLLITGSYWKGPIVRCRVEIDIKDIPMNSLIEINPPAHSFSPKRIVWEWENVEPARNVELVFMGASPRQTTIPYLEKIAAQHPEGEKGKRIRETLDKMKADFLNDEKVKKRHKGFT